MNTPPSPAIPIRQPDFAVTSDGTVYPQRKRIYLHFVSDIPPAHVIDAMGGK